MMKPANNAMYRARVWRPIRRITGVPRRILLMAFALCFLGAYYHLGLNLYQWQLPLRFLPPPSNSAGQHRMRPSSPLPPLLERVSCYGARGRLLDDSPDDELHAANLDIPYPTPFIGSHRDLGSEMSWMTADGRYGPYGYGEDLPTYTRSRVNWASVDWGALQDSCDARNAHRFPQQKPSSRLANDVRFTLRDYSGINLAPPWDASGTTRRTALVLRAYQEFSFTPEDMWFIRSLITEAALRTGGEYSVVLLYHIQDSERNIFNSRENYMQAFIDSNIPLELQSITLLWDNNLLESWYPAIGEHRTMWQVNQPLQLFALHYPEYDHYWQIELDQRFMGDAGKYLDAVDAFARNEPRKQSLERSTFSFSEQVSGSYANFSAGVDMAAGGGSSAWGPVRIPDVPPIGPDPPVENPVDDSFRWGVGEDADVLVTSFCRDVRTEHSEWLFHDYIIGFSRGTYTPRWWCPPAVARASRPLLHVVHDAQIRHGLSLPSEAIFPSFALWHGLKLSYPPQPAYMHPWDPTSDFSDETSRLPDEWHHGQARWFGVAPHESPDGFGDANPSSFADRGLSWWWTSTYPRIIIDAWLANDHTAFGMPDMLVSYNGQVYAPNFAMHPVKTS